MRILAFILLAALLGWTAGCRKAGGPALGRQPAHGKTGGQVTPDLALRGRVALVNAPARTVVVSFPLGWLPAQDRRLSVYRQGLKTGEIRITGPQMDTNIAADLIAGDAAVGDEVRED